VTITRDAITGRAQYAPELTKMHFGSRGQVCATVSRAGWSDAALERALVYCEDGVCLAVPTVCGNVAMVTRLPEPPVAEKPPAPAEEPVLPPVAELIPPVTFEQGCDCEPGSAFAGPVVVGLPAGGVWVTAAPPDVPVGAVPEPSTWALMVAGLLGIAWIRGRKAC
jgi:hypothetical protein